MKLPSQDDDDSTTHQQTTQQQTTGQQTTGQQTTGQQTTGQQTMGHGPADSFLQMGDGSGGDMRSFKGRRGEDLAAKHPMGRGAVAAAVEAMKKPR